ncbi:MAG: hypothetical protein AB8B69_08045 [Chitinophagales bacterium]
MKKSIFISFLALILFQACTKSEVQIENEIQIKDEVQIPTLDSSNFTCLDINETDVISNDCVGWDCNFKLIHRAAVDINEYEGEANGDKNVFQMVYDNQGLLGGVDYETKNILVFELDESQNSFSVTDGDLEGMRAHYRRICYCNETEFKPVSLGCIEGEKQSDGTWLIQGNVKVSYSFGDFDIKFDAQFAN